MSLSPRNQRLLAARLWMHDRMCMAGGECSSRDDHAKRTQHGFARQADVALRRDDPITELALLLHDHLCHAERIGGGCAARMTHAVNARVAAETLHATLTACG